MSEVADLDRQQAQFDLAAPGLRQATRWVEEITTRNRALPEQHLLSLGALVDLALREVARDWSAAAQITVDVVDEGDAIVIHLRPVVGDDSDLRDATEWIVYRP